MVAKQKTADLVSVSDRIRQQTASVAELSAAQHIDRLRRYRELVFVMADNGGGQLPEAAAEEMLSLLPALDVSPERMEHDVAVVIHFRNVETRMDEIRRRNAERKRDVPRLEAEAREAADAELALRREFNARLKVAEARAREARAALVAVANVPDETFGLDERRLVRLRESSPHLWRDMDERDFQAFNARRILPVIP